MRLFCGGAQELPFGGFHGSLELSLSMVGHPSAATPSVSQERPELEVRAFSNILRNYPDNGRPGHLGFRILDVFNCLMVKVLRM